MYLEQVSPMFWQKQSPCWDLRNCHDYKQIVVIDKFLKQFCLYADVLCAFDWIREQLHHALRLDHWNIASGIV